MKVETLQAIGRQVPVLRVPNPDPEGEELYRITARCLSCQVEVHLDSEEEPGLLARALGGGLAPRLMRGVTCEPCAEKQEAEEERLKVEGRFRERVSASRLPEALHGFEFSEMLAEQGREEAIAAARAWANEESPGGLCLFGEVGTGKTRLAATAAWQRLRRYSTRWVSMPILLAQLGAAFNDKARRESISVLTGKGALVLDDLDKVNPSEWARNQLFAALDTRIQAGAPLLITTNLPPSSLGEKFGEPIMSRVAEGRVLELPGQDMRLKFEFDAKEAR